jgi:hypothetical protein
MTQDLLSHSWRRLPAAEISSLGCKFYGSWELALERRVAGGCCAKLRVGTLSPAVSVRVVWVVLAVVYWGKIFRFHPSMIDRERNITTPRKAISKIRT